MLSYLATCLLFLFYFAQSKPTSDLSPIISPNNVHEKVEFFNDDSEDEDPLIPWSTPRIQDFASGLNGILKGILKGNPEKVLEGSFEFIPSQVRVGVKGILSSIAGRPVAQSETTTTKTITNKTPISTKTTLSEVDQESEDEEPE